jgi:hypothetical protein
MSKILVHNRQPMVPRVQDPDSFFGVAVLIWVRIHPQIPIEPQQ